MTETDSTYNPTIAVVQDPALLHGVEVLRPPEGLSVQIHNPEEAERTVQELMNLREFLSGSQDMGGHISPESEASSPQEALSLLSDLATLHLTDRDFTQIEANLVRSGVSPENAKIQTTELKDKSLSRVSGILSGAIRSTDFFKHSSFSALSYLSILSSGKLKSKPKMMSDGLYNSVTGTDRGKNSDISRLRQSADREFDDTSGLHSLLIHTRQREELDGNSRYLDIYFPAPTLIEDMPYVLVGQDAHGHYRGRIIDDGEEAHKGGVRSRYTEVTVDATAEFLASLPEPKQRIMVEDVAFMHDTVDPVTASNYEFDIEQAEVVIDSGHIDFLAKQISEDSEPSEFINERLMGMYFTGDEVKNRTLRNDLELLEQELKEKPFEELEFGSEEGRRMFAQLLSDIGEARTEITGVFPEFDADIPLVVNYAQNVAITRLILRHLGRSEQWIRNNVHVSLDVGLNEQGMALHNRFTQALNNKKLNDKQPTTFFVQSGKDKLQFSQRDMAVAAVEAYAAATGQN